MAITPDANINEILFALSSTAEVLQEVRMGQKKHLKDLNRLVRFGLPKSKKLESVDKTYLLLQNVLGQAPMDDVTMQREQIMIGEKAGRVLQGLWCVQCNYRSCGLSFASPFLLFFLANNFIVKPQRPHGGRPRRPCCPLVGDLAS
jgi:hypothetical protein